MDDDFDPLHRGAASRPHSLSARRVRQRGQLPRGRLSCEENGRAGAAALFRRGPHSQGVALLDTPATPILSWLREKGGPRVGKFSQKELAHGKLSLEPGQKVPGVRKKLFALQNLCTDCRVCEVACSLVHSSQGELNPAWARLRVEAPPQGAPGAGESGFGFAVAICHPCATPPPCAVVCPTDAFYYDPVTYAAVIDQGKCIQCMECVPACPF